MPAEGDWNESRQRPQQQPRQSKRKKIKRYYSNQEDPQAKKTKDRLTMVKRRAGRRTLTRKQENRCSKQNINRGFWVGVAIAVLYLNFKRPQAVNSNLFSATSTTLAPEGDATKAASTAAPLSYTPGAATGASARLPTPAPTDAVVSAIIASKSTVSSDDVWSAKPAHNHRNFLELAKGTGTDKVWGSQRFEAGCKQDATKCPLPDMVNPKCRMMSGHFYDTLYQRWLGKYSTDDAEPFQFLEIGFYNGKGFDAYKQFLPRAETHSIEIACLPEGPLAEGKWPWGNFPEINPRYQEYLDTNQLHCGDGSSYEFLQEVWTKKMKRPDAPPLKVVVEDASHLSDHMAKSLFFWFPKIEPGGILVMEDVQPIQEAHQFRTDVLPQVLKDLHYCGDPRYSDRACFPTIWPLLQSVHCELHICIFERNDQPSVEYNQKDLAFPPPHALHAADCLLGSSS